MNKSQLIREVIREPETSKPIVKKSVCEHHWKRIEYGYNKEYFKCKLCGKTEW